MCMTLPNLIKKPVVAAILGASAIAAPVGVLYMACATRAVATTSGRRARRPGGGEPGDRRPARLQLHGAALRPCCGQHRCRHQGSPAITPRAMTTTMTMAARQCQSVRRTARSRRSSAVSPHPSSSPSRGEGSGFIVSSDGVILTNAHVVSGATEVDVKLTDRREFKAKIVGTDPRTDVALLKIDAKDLPTLRIGDPSKVKVGQWVVAMGAPFGFENSVTAGIVGEVANAARQRLRALHPDRRAVNPGNSGGPLFDLNGEVIGINSQIYSQTGGYMGLSFAIPIDVAMHVRASSSIRQGVARTARRHDTGGRSESRRLLRAQAARGRAGQRRGRAARRLTRASSPAT